MNLISIFSVLINEPLKLIPKISKHHFFQDIQNSFHGEADIVLEPNQKKFLKISQQIWSLEVLEVLAH